MPVYFIRSDQISNNKVAVGIELAHHLRDVLRLKVGESLSLIDELPKRYLTRVIASYPDPLILEIESEETLPSGNRPNIHLGLGLLKKDKMDWVIQKATELGITRLSPLLTKRTVVKTRPERISSQGARWQKIAKEASQQSCRWSVPQIDNPLNFNAFLKSHSIDGFRFIFSEKPQTKLGQKTIQSETRRNPLSGTLIVGPEGGWESSEISEAIGSNFLPVSLGNRVLRAETAAIAALAIVQYEMNDGICGSTS